MLNASKKYWWMFAQAHCQTAKFNPHQLFQLLYTILLLLYYVLSAPTSFHMHWMHATVSRQLLLTVAYVHAFSACGHWLEQKNIIQYVDRPTKNLSKKSIITVMPTFHRLYIKLRLGSKHHQYHCTYHCRGFRLWKKTALVHRHQHRHTGLWHWVWEIRTKIKWKCEAVQYYYYTLQLYVLTVASSLGSSQLFNVTHSFSCTMYMYQCYSWEEPGDKARLTQSVQHNQS